MSSSSSKKITVVTAASCPQFQNGLFQFLDSLYKHVSDVHCIVYDLGFDEPTRLTIRIRWPTVELRTFDFSKYPDYYNVRIHAGQYAWKPAILHEVASNWQGGGILLWCDSFNKVYESLTNLIEVTKKHIIYTPTSSGNVKKWTHPGTLQFMNIPEDHFILRYPNRNGAIIAFSMDHPNCKQFIYHWARLAGIRECIAPDGSDRTNHRQDQTLLTLLYYDFIAKHNVLPEDDYVGVSIHNYIDGVRPHNY